MALGQTAGCPRANRAKKFMCSPRNTGNINFSLWLTGGLSQGCPGFQKVYVFKVYVPFSCPNSENQFLNSESCSENTSELPGGPKDRKNSFSLDRLKKPFPHARKNHSRLKLSFLVRKFHSRSKISIPGPVFLQPGRGQIEKTILDRKFHSEIKILNFSISLRITKKGGWV